ncbi:MAG: DNA-directed RNA polymerase subunit alpha, partial [Mucispirillum sp.]|nr:DNA-directed RNA polymerase subunit alpha [Mucispirillum sp.]
TQEQRRVYIRKKGKGAVTAGDIQGDETVEVLNPDQHILTISDDSTEVYMEFYVERGIGYVPSGEFEDKFSEIDILPIDAIFTPIKRVNYHVENARVGQSTDYDKLTMEIETDGSVRPEDAIAFSAKIVKDYMTQFINFEEKEDDETDVEENKGNSQIIEMLDNSIEELELSVRAYNCLKNANIKTLYELCSKTDGEMLKTKNFGRKSLEEIKKVLSDLGLSLGMDLENLGYKKTDTEVE